MLIGHMDTVFPLGTAAARPLSVDGERAYGPGVSDMKSGLLNIVHAPCAPLPREVRDSLSICVCMNPDEEIGSLHSSDWLASVAKQARQVPVAKQPVPTDPYQSAQGDGSLSPRFHRQAAHAGNEPQKGAAPSPSWVTGSWPSMPSPTSRAAPPSTSASSRGGNGANIVPAHASAVVDVRFWDNQEAARSTTGC